MNMTITSRQHRRLQASIRTGIRRYLQSLKLIDSVGTEVFSAGMTFPAAEEAVALWMCAPARLFGGDVPLKVVWNGQGRPPGVVGLAQIAHGGY